jgi:acyl-CoA synthetase (AMP-forming)/AMP-acid ligase II
VLPAFKCPLWYTFLDDLPKTATGKIQRFKLREQAPHPTPLPAGGERES